MGAKGMEMEPESKEIAVADQIVVALFAAEREGAWEEEGWDAKDPFALGTLTIARRIGGGKRGGPQGWRGALGGGEYAKAEKAAREDLAEIGRRLLGRLKASGLRTIADEADRLSREAAEPLWGEPSGGVAGFWAEVRAAAAILGEGEEDPQEGKVREAMDRLAEELGAFAREEGFAGWSADLWRWDVAAGNPEDADERLCEGALRMLAAAEEAQALGAASAKAEPAGPRRRI